MEMVLWHDGEGYRKGVACRKTLDPRNGQRQVIFHSEHHWNPTSHTVVLNIPAPPHFPELVVLTVYTTQIDSFSTYSLVYWVVTFASEAILPTSWVVGYLTY